MKKVGGEVTRQKESDPPFARKKKKVIRTPVHSNKKSRRLHSDA